MLRSFKNRHLLSCDCILTLRGAKDCDPISVSIYAFKSDWMDVLWVWRHAVFCGSFHRLHIMSSSLHCLVQTYCILVIFIDIYINLIRPSPFPFGALDRLTPSISLILSPYPFIFHHTWLLRLQTLSLCCLALFFASPLRVVSRLRNLARWYTRT
jgi:hypothetical protein